ncbi:MAG: 1-acyl-sn-glycerol-3-phosphate acyltransferase [Rhodobacteraceae bacterium]|nr:1-acyl-sn-glycerol-3-phosphate acyltransferase [Paracoccaceae bacterium]
MTSTVELPLWLVLLGGAALAVMVLQRALLPSARWYLRRRMERVVAHLNERLERPIQPFKLARRHDMIQRLIYDPKVMEAVADYSRANGVPEQVGVEVAERYAREIVPSFSASAYFGIGIRLARWLSTRLFHVEISYADEAAISDIPPEATVIFVMNHRSNMDYLLVTYLAAERSALSYAVGEWARIWPLSALIRSMGAYFIRRRYRDDLYRRVLARYVQLATAGGVAQAMFPEGGLSVDGRLAEPKLGLLSYMIEGFDPEGQDFVFVPVALNYDRVLEDRVLTDAAATGDRRFRGSFRTAFAFALRWFWRRVTRRARRFGAAGVAFGKPLSLKSMSLTPASGAQVVGNILMERIAEVMPVLPVPLAALVLTREGPDLTRDAFIRGFQETVLALRGMDVRVHLGAESPEMAAEAALTMLSLRRMISTDRGVVRIEPKSAALFTFYAASIGHHMDAVAAKISSDSGQSKLDET